MGDINWEVIPVAILMAVWMAGLYVATGRIRTLELENQRLQRKNEMLQRAIERRDEADHG